MFFCGETLPIDSSLLQPAELALVNHVGRGEMPPDGHLKRRPSATRRSFGSTTFLIGGFNTVLSQLQSYTCQAELFNPAVTEYNLTWLQQEDIPAGRVKESTYLQ